MFTKDIKKGSRVRLRNGWYATVLDNARGNIRFCEVEGIYTEMGSVYAHDIMIVELPNGDWRPVEHTPAQVKCRAMNRALGF